MMNRLLFRAAENQDGGLMHPRIGDRDVRYTLADCLCVMREAKRSLYKKASRGELEYEDAMSFLRLAEWAEVGVDFSQLVDRAWKVSAIGGLKHFTEDERKHFAQLIRANPYRGALVAVCAHIDQVAQ